MAESISQAISKESAGFLEDVKKGKPRKFAMICKGTKIISLVVYKKGSVEQKKKEAKESGRGDFYFGVVDGKGMEISFKLARADGFEEAPVRSTILKEFLEENASLKSKPLFEIVDTLGLVLDDSDPLVQRFLQLQPAALDVCEKRPELADEINALCMTIGRDFDQDLRDNIESNLSRLESLLQSSGQPSSSSSSVATPSQPANEGPELLAKLQALGPDLKDFIVNNPDAKTSILDQVAKVKSLVAESQWSDARQTLQSLTDFIKNGSQSTGSASTNEDSTQDPLEDWKATRNWAIQSLKVVAQDIAAAKDPLSAAAIIKIKAVIANLTEAPSTPEQVNELDRYLSQDDVIDDICNFAFDIRTPLLEALPQLG